MNDAPKVGDRRPCTARGCAKTQTFVETVVVHPQERATERGIELVRESGPGWICPDNHRQLHNR